MELTKLPNIGPELARSLNEVEIRDSEACFHRLTALEGAVQGVKKSQLTLERKAELREFFDGLPK